MTSTGTRREWFLFALFSVLLLVAEHASPLHPVAPEDWDSTFLIGIQEGSEHRRIAYLLLGFIGLVMLAKRRASWPRFDGGLLYSGVALIAWDCLSVSWSEEPYVALRRLLVLFLVLIWASGCAVTWSGKTLVRFIVVSTLINLLLSIGAEINAGMFAPLDPSYRLGGTLAPNLEGMNCLILALAATAAAAAAGKSRNRWMFRAIVIFALAGLLLTKSRTSLAGLPIAFGVYYWFVSSKKVKYAGLYLVILVLFSGYVLKDTSIGDSLYHLVPRSGDATGSLNGRLPLWHELDVHFISKRPILGYGYSTFWTDRRIDGVSSIAGWGVAAAHSAYLEVMLEAGVVGVILYLILLINVFRCAIIQYRKGRGSEYAFVGAFIAIFLVVGITESVVLTRSSAVFAYSIAAVLMVGVKRDYAEEWEYLSTGKSRPAMKYPERSESTV